MTLFWMVLTVLLATVEALTVQLVCIWLACGSLIAMICAALNLNITVQIVAFIIASTLLLICTRPLVKRLMKNSTEKTNVDAIIGKTAVVTDDIDNLKENGTVKLGGVIWTARSADNTVINKDSVVTIEKVEGVKVYVRQSDVLK
ncbi:MAG: NfeD family protein [Clostridia bacterium]|nr:NfeD family protein [Clostridia bacterium]